MKKLIFALLALAACSPKAPAPPAAHDDHASMPGMAGMDSPAPVAGVAATQGSLSITGAWAAATPGGADVAAGYLTIANEGPRDDRLIAIASPRAARVETHEMIMDGAMMTMRKVDDLNVRGGGATVLSPGGMHLMFFGITAPFVAGQTVPVTLTFEHAGAVTLQLPVRAR